MNPAHSLRQPRSTPSSNDDLSMPAEVLPVTRQSMAYHPTAQPEPDKAELTIESLRSPALSRPTSWCL